MSLMRFDALLYTSHHAPQNPFKNTGVIGDSLRDIHNSMVNCLSTEAAYARVHMTSLLERILSHVILSEPSCSICLGMVLTLSFCLHLSSPTCHVSSAFGTNTMIGFRFSHQYNTPLLLGPVPYAGEFPYALCPQIP
jgi:hypothetical protein